jgi:putative zinc finger/helix-turn-helix YgiT family protein
MARATREGVTMNCTLCGAETTRRRATNKNPYRYTFSGLKNVLLCGIDVRICTSCKAESPIIPAVGELHRIIADTLSRKPAPLAGEEVRFLRKNIGIPAKKLAALLGMAPETLSRVENGKTRGLPVAQEHLVRLMAREAAGNEQMRQAVFEVAESLDHKIGPRTPLPPIRLKLDPREGWKAAA